MSEPDDPESTVLDERAVRQESIVAGERAGMSESTVRRERAESTESIVGDERAGRGMMTVQVLVPRPTFFRQRRKRKRQAKFCSHGRTDVEQSSQCRAYGALDVAVLDQKISARAQSRGGPFEKEPALLWLEPSARLHDHGELPIRQPKRCRRLLLRHGTSTVTLAVRLNRVWKPHNRILLWQIS
jgi:hypothetical protein